MFFFAPMFFYMVLNGRSLLLFIGTGQGKHMSKMNSNQCFKKELRFAICHNLIWPHFHWRSDVIIWNCGRILDDSTYLGGYIIISIDQRAIIKSYFKKRKKKSHTSCSVVTKLGKNGMHSYPWESTNMVWYE